MLLGLSPDLERPGLERPEKKRCSGCSRSKVGLATERRAAGMQSN